MYCVDHLNKGGKVMIKAYKNDCGTFTIVLNDSEVFEVNDNTTPNGVNIFCGFAGEFKFDENTIVHPKELPKGVMYNIMMRLLSAVYVD